jgi:hypothetical protein
MGCAERVERTGQRRLAVGGPATVRTNDENSVRALFSVKRTGSWWSRPAGTSKVTVDESMRELPLPLRELQSVRLQLVAAGVAIAHCLPLGDERAELFV